MSTSGLELKGLSQTLIEENNDGVFVVQDGRFVFANERFAEIVDSSVDELLGRDFLECVAPEERELVGERYRRRMEGDDVASEYRITAYTDEGERVLTEAKLSLVEYGGEVADMAIIRDISGRADQEKLLEALNVLGVAEKEMVGASSKERALEISLETATGLLETDLAGAWLYEEGDGVLEPVAVTSEAESLLEDFPRYSEEGESLSWEAFDESSFRFFDDLREEPERYNDGTDIRSELILPLGEYGVINIGSRETGVFDDFDEKCAKLLSVNTTAALDKINKEEELAEKGERLKKDKEELEILTRLIRHDVQNEMNLIYALSQELHDQLTGSEGEKARTVKESAHCVVELTQNVKELIELIEEEGPTKTEINLMATLNYCVDKAAREFDYADFAFAPEVSEIQVRADSLLSRLFQNLLNNAVMHNDEEEPVVEVSVEEEEEEDSVTVSVADNGPGVPEEQREEIFGKGEKGVESEGTGIGLFLVNRLAESYGGEVWVEENDPKGADFKVELQKV